MELAGLVDGWPIRSKVPALWSSRLRGRPRRSARGPFAGFRVRYDAKARALSPLSAFSPIASTAFLFPLHPTRTTSDSINRASPVCFPVFFFILFRFGFCVLPFSPTQCTTMIDRGITTEQDRANETTTGTTIVTMTETTTEDGAAIAAAPGRRAANGTRAITSTIARGMVKPHCLEDEKLKHALSRGCHVRLS